MTVLDLGERLGTRPVEITENSHNVVFKDEPVGLLVDGIGDVVEVDEKLMEPPPPNVTPPLSEFIEAAALLDGRLLIVLSADRLLGLQKGKRRRPPADSGTEAN